MSQASADNPQLSLALSQVLYDSNPNDPNEMASRLSRMTNARDKHAADVSLSQTGLAWDRMRDYNSVTTLIGQMNEAYNANKFVGDALLKEETRVARINNDLQKELYKLQQEVLFTTYQRQERQLKTTMALATACVASLIAVLTAMARQGLLHVSIVAIATAVLVALYLLAMVSLTRRAARRRNYHWRQFYWNVAFDHDKQFDGACQRARSEQSISRSMRHKMRDLAQDIREAFAASPPRENGADAPVEPFDEQDSWGGNVVGSEASMTTAATKRKKQQQKSSDEEEEEEEKLNKHIRRGFIKSLKRMSQGVPPSELVLPTENMRARLREVDASLADRYDDVLAAVRSDVADFIDLPQPLREDISALMRDIWAIGSLASSAPLVRDAFVEALRQLRAGMPPEKANLPSDAGTRTLEDHDDELASRYATLLSRVRAAHADPKNKEEEEEGDEQAAVDDEDEDEEEGKANTYSRVEVPDDLHQELLALSRSIWKLDSIASGSLRSQFVSALERMAQGAGPSRVALPGASERRALRRSAPDLHERYKSLLERVREMHADEGNPVLQEYGISASDFPLVLNTPWHVKRAARTIKAYLTTVPVRASQGVYNYDDDELGEEETDMTVAQREKLISFLGLFARRQEHTDLSIVSHDEASGMQDVLDRLTKSNKRIKHAMRFFYALAINAQSEAFKKRFRNNAADARALLQQYKGENVNKIIAEILQDDAVTGLVSVPDDVADKAKAARAEVKGYGSFHSKAVRETLMSVLGDIASGAVQKDQLRERMDEVEQLMNANKKKLSEDKEELFERISADIFRPLARRIQQRQGGGSAASFDLDGDNFVDEDEDDDEAVSGSSSSDVSPSDFPITFQTPSKVRSAANAIVSYLTSSDGQEELAGVDGIDALENVLAKFTSGSETTIEFEDVQGLRQPKDNLDNNHKLSWAMMFFMLKLYKAQPDDVKDKLSNKSNGSIEKMASGSDEDIPVSQIRRLLQRDETTIEMSNGR